MELHRGGDAPTDGGLAGDDDQTEPVILAEPASSELPGSPLDVDCTAQALAMDIQRPVLPFDLPPAPEATPGQKSRSARSGVAAPHTLSGIIDAPPADPLPFTKPADEPERAPAASGGGGRAPDRPVEDSVWSRGREHSTLDPSELPSSLVPPSVAPPPLEAPSPRGRAALWSVVAGVVLAMVGVALALTL
ncbi:MAG: hypothetical protein JRI23_33900 [Deltaproteobacteria bacterium]|jgi:hypothetical protein|nr:hypothetical protein [Deltaproteobacteria bacterium]MBW2537287.1 hypothetical protein [Deltaproteobacteria bacterium]